MADFTDSCNDAVESYMHNMDILSDSVGSFADSLFSDQPGASIGQVINDGIDAYASGNAVDSFCGGTDADTGNVAGDPGE